MISILLATKNSETRIERTLTSFSKICIEEDWKVIIVDNGSTDNTHEILEKYKGDLPLEVLNEPKAGKNICLNKALPQISGDLVVLTDDDVRVTPKWLEQIRNLTDKHPDIDIFGGEIRPEWETPPEKWILDWAPLGHLYAINHKNSDGICDPGKIWGPNMVVRAHVFHDPSNRFDERIGPNGTPDYPMGSETDFTKRMHKRGYKCWSSSEFFVYHWIPKTSLTEEWIFKRAFRLGKGVSLASKLRGEPVNKFSFIKKYVGFKLLSFFMAACNVRNKKSFKFKYKSQYNKGALYGAHCNKL